MHRQLQLAVRRPELRGGLLCAAWIKQESVVVTLYRALILILQKVAADAFRGTEIKAAVFYRLQRRARNAFAVYRQIAVGVEL